MEPNEVKNELDRIVKEVKEEGLKAKKEFDQAVADRAKKEDVDAIKHAFHEYTEKAEEKITELKGIAEAQGVKINELMEFGAKAKSNKSFGDQLTDALTEKLEFNTAMKGSIGSPRGSITAKVAATMTTANILPSVATAIPYSLVDGGGEIIGIARREPFIREILNARPINSMYAWWAEAVNPDGGATTVAEGAAKPLIDSDVQERTAKVEKVAAFAKMSKEVLADVQGFRNFIEEELRASVELEMDKQLYEGNGTSPNLKGLYTWATTLSVAGTPFALGVDNANNFDVLLAAKAVMASTYFFNANVALVNPLDLAIMQMLKESPTSGNYVMPPFSTNSGLNVGGMRVIANPEVDAGTFVVLDTSKPRLRIREDFTIDYGYENDDFRKNLVSVVGEMRALLYLPTNYAGAVLKGTFATLKAAMETA